MKLVTKFVIGTLLSVYLLSYSVLSWFGSYAERMVTESYRNSLDSSGYFQVEWHVLGTYEQGVLTMESGTPRSLVRLRLSSLTKPRLAEVIFLIYYPLILVDGLIIHRHSRETGRWIS